MRQLSLQTPSGRDNKSVDAENEAGSRVLLAQAPRPSLISGHDSRYAAGRQKIITRSGFTGKRRSYSGIERLKENENNLGQKDKNKLDVCIF